jgi:hypothetical protein
VRSVGGEEKVLTRWGSGGAKEEKAVLKAARTLLRRRWRRRW